MDANQKLLEVMNALRTHAPAGYGNRIVNNHVKDNRLSLYKLLAIPAQLLDYRVFVSEIQVKMHASLFIFTESKKLEFPCYDVEYLLGVLVLKFPEYFGSDDLEKIHTLFLTEFRSSPDYGDFIPGYLKSYYQSLRTLYSFDTDYLGYHSPEAVAIREAGDCKRIVEVILLYLEVQKAQAA